MAIALVQHAVVISWAGTYSFTSPTTPGNLVTATVLWTDNTQTITSVLDPHGDAMIARGKVNLTSMSGWAKQRFWLPNVSAGSAAFTVTLSGSGASVIIFLTERSGCQTSSTPDSGNTTGDAWATGTGTSPL